MLKYCFFTKDILSRNNCCTICRDDSLWRIPYSFFCKYTRNIFLTKDNDLFFLIYSVTDAFPPNGIDYDVYGIKLAMNELFLVQVQSEK